MSCLVSWRQTPLKPRARLQKAGVRHPRHVARLDRFRGRPQALLGAALGPRSIPQPASGTATTRDEARREAPRASVCRSWCGRLRTRRTRDGHRIIRHGRLTFTWRRRSMPRRRTRFHRQVPRRCLRRRRRGPTGHGCRGHRRHHGAHRRGRHPLGRQFVWCRRSSAPERHLTHPRLHAPAWRVHSTWLALMNVQHSRRRTTIYVLRSEPAASRTVPYLSKAAGAPLAQVAAKVMAGRTLADPASRRTSTPAGVFVKSPVFPFVLSRCRHHPGPEMKSTGEVMVVEQLRRFPATRRQLSVGQRLPETGYRVRQREQRRQGETAARSRARPGRSGFRLTAPRGTAGCPPFVWPPMSTSSSR